MGECFSYPSPFAEREETRTPPSQETNPLTPRQIEALEFLARGLTNAEISGVLEIVSAPVKVHVSAITAALHVTSGRCFDVAKAHS